MMKSMILALALFAAAAAEDQQPLCFRGNDQCDELKETAKGYFDAVRERARAIPALKLTRPGSPGAGLENRAKLVEFLDNFQRLFNESTKYDCKVEACICNAGALQCTSVLDKVKEGITKATPPDCVENSEKAKAFFEKFRADIQAGNKTVIAEDIQTFRTNVQQIKKDGNVAELTCIRDTLQAIRKDVKEKLSQYDVQQNCDFCKAA